MNKKTNNTLKILIILVLGAYTLFFLTLIIKKGIPTYSFVQPRDYYSGILKMRAEGIENLYYEDSDDFLTFITSFIGDRRVRLTAQVRDTRPIKIMSVYACPQSRIDTDDLVSSDPKYANIKYCYPNFEYDNCVFVVDSYWKNTKEIVAFQVDSEIIVCSEEEYTDLLYNRERFILDNSEDVFEYMNAICPSEYRTLPQILIILSMQFIGLLVSIVALKGKYKYLAFAISFPIGSAVCCMAIVALDLLGISFGLFSLLIIYALLVVILFGINCINKYCDIKSCAFSILVSMLILFGLSMLKMNYSGPDSLMKVILGRRLAVYGTVNDILETAIQFGMFEISMHGVSNLFGVEVFNLIYPYMSITCIAIIIALTYYFSGKTSRFFVFPVCILSVLILVTNSDYFLLSFWILSNGILGGFFLVVASFLLLSVKENVNLSIIIMLSSFVIITTRLEGALFVCLATIIALLIDKNYTQTVKASVKSVGMVIVWNVSLMIKLGYISKGTFWTTSKGLFLISIAIIVLIVSLLRDKAANINGSIWEKRYDLIVISTFILSCVAYILKSEVVAENYRPYLYHILGKSDGSNSYLLWTFVLLSAVFCFGHINDYEKYSYCVIVLYLLMVFDIMLFRTGYPIHYAVNDSSRRMIVHIMPFAIWNSLFCLGESFSGLK